LSYEGTSDLLYSARNGNLEELVHFLKARQGYIVKNIKKNGYREIDEFRYGIPEQKEVPVWYTDIYRSIQGIAAIYHLNTNNRQ
jgi:hypothetical protein